MIKLLTSKFLLKNYLEVFGYMAFIQYFSIEIISTTRFIHALIGDNIEQISPLSTSVYQHPRQHLQKQLWKETSNAT